MSGRLVIAIDGPGGSGKTTLARRLAAALDLPFLDTGLLYRAVAARLRDAGRDAADERAAQEAARSVVAGDLERADLRDEAIGQGASRVAAQSAVRAALLAFQRRFALEGRGAVLAGRDIGTVVCPDATRKIFVTASDQERARRRVEQLRRKGAPAIYERVLAELRERDERDSARTVAPLRPAEDALLLDTTELDAEEAYRAAFAFVLARSAGAGEGAAPCRMRAF